MAESWGPDDVVFMGGVSRMLANGALTNKERLVAVGQMLRGRYGSQIGNRAAAEFMEIQPPPRQGPPWKRNFGIESAQ